MIIKIEMRRRESTFFLLFPQDFPESKYFSKCISSIKNTLRNKISHSGKYPRITRTRHLNSLETQPDRMGRRPVSNGFLDVSWNYASLIPAAAVEIR